MSAAGIPVALGVAALAVTGAAVAGAAAVWLARGREDLRRILRERERD